MGVYIKYGLLRFDSEFFSYWMCKKKANNIVNLNSTQTYWMLLFFVAVYFAQKCILKSQVQYIEQIDCGRSKIVHFVSP